MKKYLSLFLSLLISGSFLAAQHEHHPMPKDTVPVKQAKDSMPHHPAPKKGKEKGGGHMMHHMPSHAFSLELPMSRNASGTGWNPDESPMYMWLRGKEKTSWMFHGNIFLRYTRQDLFRSGSRGAESFSAPNWFMAMMNRTSGKRGLWNATLMLSLDKFTEGGNGYPLLFQSGETWKGNKLVDRQHPHDLFSALSIGYTYRLSKQADLFAYFGYPGEPALGAPAFMHRVSSMNNPDAPLGHHWQDATHITFGTGTIGFRYKQFKAEGSIFTGREPDEERFGFDKARFDSYAYRVSWNPAPRWALQFSQGFIKDPEPAEPGNLTRTTASVLYTQQLKKQDHLSAAAIWGLNDKGGHHQEHSFLLEGNYQYRKNAIYTRYEFVQKSPEELQLGLLFPKERYNIHALTGGFNHRIARFAGIDLMAGTQLTIYAADQSLDPLYGKNPVSGQVYLQFRPVRH